MRMGIGVCVLVICLLLVGVSASANPDCWATGSAWMSTDPGYEGYWKYCYEFSWSGLPHGLSHVDVFLMLDDCSCVCAPGYFAFADTVGSGPGDNGGPCTVYYHGFFECYGDPIMGVDTPLIKFEYYENDCEPETDGWAYLCFYSVAAPIPAGTYDDAVGIKFGTDTDMGRLDGVLPSCDAASGTDATSWGNVKALYR